MVSDVDLALNKLFPSEDDQELERALTAIGRKAVDLYDSPFKNLQEELSFRSLFGLFEGKPDVQQRLAESAFGKDNVLVQDGAYFARHKGSEPFKPIDQPDAFKTPMETTMRIAGGLATGDFNFGDPLGDIAQAAPQAARIGLDIAGGVGAGPLGAAGAEAVSQEAVLATALSMGLITPEEFKNKQIDAAVNTALVGVLSFGGEVAGKMVKEAIKNPTVRRVGKGALGKLARQLDKFKAGTRAVEGARVQEEAAEQTVRKFAEGADPDAFAKTVSQGLAKSYKKARQAVKTEYDKARALSAKQLAAKDKLNSQLFQNTRGTIVPRSTRVQETVGLADIVTGAAAPVERTSIGAGAKTVGRARQAPSLDFALGARPSIDLGDTVDLSDAFTAFSEAADGTTVRELVDSTQRGLKNKLSVEAFDPSNLTIAEANNALEYLTGMDSSLAKATNQEAIRLRNQVGTLKSFVQDRLDEIAPTNIAAKQFLKARTQLRQLENQQFPDSIKKIMAGTRTKPSGEVVILEDIQPDTEDVINFVFDRSNPTEKGLIKSNLDAVNLGGFVNKQAPKIAVAKGVRDATEEVGTRLSSLENIDPDAFQLSMGLKTKAGPVGGIGSGGEEIIERTANLPQATKTLEQFAGESAMVEAPRIDKRRLLQSVIGKGGLEGTEEISKDRLTGLVDADALKPVQDLLRTSRSAEKALATATTGGSSLRGLPIPFSGTAGRLLGAAAQAGERGLGTAAGVGGGALRFLTEAAANPPSSISTALGSGSLPLAQQLLFGTPSATPEAAQRLRGRVQFVDRR